MSNITAVQSLFNPVPVQKIRYYRNTARFPGDSSFFTFSLPPSAGKTAAQETCLPPRPSSKGRGGDTIPESPDPLSFSVSAPKAHFSFPESNVSPECPAFSFPDLYFTPFACPEAEESIAAEAERASGGGLPAEGKTAFCPSSLPFPD